MIRRLFALSVLVMSSVAVAHADSISGFFSATGTDIFTTSTITFGSAQVAGAIGGTFATYLTDGEPNQLCSRPASLFEWDEYSPAEHDAILDNRGWRNLHLHNHRLYGAIH